MLREKEKHKKSVNTFKDDWEVPWEEITISKQIGEGKSPGIDPVKS